MPSSFAPAHPPPSSASDWEKSSLEEKKKGYITHPGSQPSRRPWGPGWDPGTCGGAGDISRALVSLQQDFSEPCPKASFQTHLGDGGCFEALVEGKARPQGSWGGFYAVPKVEEKEGLQASWGGCSRAQACPQEQLRSRLSNPEARRPQVQGHPGPSRMEGHEHMALIFFFLIPRIEFRGP